MNTPLPPESRSGETVGTGDGAHVVPRPGSGLRRSSAWGRVREWVAAGATTAGIALLVAGAVLDSGAAKSAGVVLFLGARLIDAVDTSLRVRARLDDPARLGGCGALLSTGGGFRFGLAVFCPLGVIGGVAVNLLRQQGAPTTILEDVMLGAVAGLIVAFAWITLVAARGWLAGRWSDADARRAAEPPPTLRGLRAEPEGAVTRRILTAAAAGPAVALAALALIRESTVLSAWAAGLAVLSILAAVRGSSPRAADGGRTQDGEGSASSR